MPDTVRLELVVMDPPSGTVVTASGERRAFSGWLELAEAFRWLAAQTR